MDFQCDENGKCECKSPIIGDKCDYCPPETYDFPNCHGKFLNQ